MTSSCDPDDDGHTCTVPVPEDVAEQLRHGEVDHDRDLLDGDND